MLLDQSLRGMSLTEWLVTSSLFAIFALFAKAIYNLFFHPLAHIPGPFFARASGIPSWYYAIRGDRHIWVAKQFDRYGKRVRIEPNTVVFLDPQAETEIYGMKANVQRSGFYSSWKTSKEDVSTINSVDFGDHARMRKFLNVAFTEQSTRAASTFVVQHIDRWNELQLQAIGGKEGWSDPVDISQSVTALTFDIMGELAFGASFNIKEPGDNPFRVVPHNIESLLKRNYVISRSPFLDLLLWLKPRGLDNVINSLAPSSVISYFHFVRSSVENRIALYKSQESKPEQERRQDLFYFLCEAKDPSTGLPAYDGIGLLGEANMLIVAGSDTTAIILSALFFYLTGDADRYRKLTCEIRGTFASADEIVPGPKLMACEYLRAFIQETLRMCPVLLSEMPREVRPGGQVIRGDFYPAGTIVGVPGCPSKRNPDVFPQPSRFWPERWIVDEKAGVTREEVARMRNSFHPFAGGPGACAGKNIAMMEMLMTVARTLHRMDVRRAPGSTLGCDPRNRDEYHLTDAYISLRQGPEVQFKRREGVKA